MKVFFSEAFLVSLKKYRSLKKVIQKKVDLIIANPLLLMITLMEPKRDRVNGATR
jgi:hypothetical protein